MTALALLAQWQECLEQFKHELPSQQFKTWISPLVAELANDQLVLIAPNRFICDWVKNQYLNRLQEILADLNGGRTIPVELLVGDKKNIFQTQNTNSDYIIPSNTAPIEQQPIIEAEPLKVAKSSSSAVSKNALVKNGAEKHESFLNAVLTFDSFVEGKSNQLALAAARQVAANEKGGYNPLFIYGGVGLGKTHLMHAIGNELLRKNPHAKIFYTSTADFVKNYIKAVQINAVSEFNRYYRKFDALLIDDIQFFGSKEKSQEEFFHIFNTLLESGKKIILTSDRYPKEINDLEERLKSRFGWGLAISVEPPELETRVAILMKKAEEENVDISNEAAFFIAQKIRSNVRDLEGALNLVKASAEFTGSPVTVQLVKESLKNLIALQDRLVSIDNIQRTVAEYYRIKIVDLLSKTRKRSITRPRQLAMALSKELTQHSLPEIGDAFGGRDHTTVLHACRKMQELQETSADIQEDYKNLMRLLTT